MNNFQDVRVVFMGTPEFAVPCLQRLLDEEYQVVGVYTQPDKPKGRGLKLAPPPVKVLAQERGIPVFQPATLKDDEVFSELCGLAPDLIVVVAYGKILPRRILELPKLGCVNIHASLLPKYRGAAPIQWAVIGGEKESGVTAMFMGEGLDTGDMIQKQSTPIGPDETAGEFHDRLSLIGAEVLSRTMPLLCEGRAPREAQRDELSCYAPMLNKELARIDWTKSATELHNLVRGLCPWPVAYTSFGGQLLKIFKTRPTAGKPGAKPGTILKGDKEIEIACGEGGLQILELQLQGGKRMGAQDFLRGHSLETGTNLEGKEE